MRRIIIVCEGQTEREFCEKILAPHFIPLQLHIQNPLIKKSKGGIVKWGVLQLELTIYLKADPSAYLTTLLDYYGLETKAFPQWEQARNMSNKTGRMDFLEKAMSDGIEPDLRRRFIPYLQLHEFEGLLFNDIRVFLQQIPEADLTDIEALRQIIDEHPNPELINEGKESCPSRRLQRLIRGYSKVVYGCLLAESIGLPNIRAKSPRFHQWLTRLENLAED
jgi:Domain of unknown function (DUF4276)